MLSHTEWAPARSGLMVSLSLLRKRRLHHSHEHETASRARILSSSGTKALSFMKYPSRGLHKLRKRTAGKKGTPSHQ